MKSRIHYDQIRIPEGLVRQLQQFERKLFSLETTVSIFGAISGFLLSFFLLFISDRFWNTPVSLRILLSLGSAAACGLFAWIWLHHWLWRRRSLRELSRIIQRQHRVLGDRLLGIVELAEEQDASTNISEELRQAAIRQVAREAESLDFSEALSRTRSRFWVTSCTILALVSALPFLILPEAGLTTLKRWLNPVAPVDRFTLVTLENLPDRIIVPHGEPFELRIQLSSESVWTPDKVTCQLTSQIRKRASIVDGLATFKLPGQTEDREISIRVGDISRRLKVTPVYRPELLSLNAMATLPDYLGYPQVKREIVGRRADFLHGTKVALSGEISRDIRAAEIAYSEGKSTPAIKGRTFTTPDLHLLTNRLVRLKWTDEYDLNAKRPFELDLHTREDQVPFVDAEGSSRSIAILDDEVISLNFSASDDYGLKDLGVSLAWAPVSTTATNVIPVETNQVLIEGDHQMRELHYTYDFAASAYGIPNQSMISLRAYAHDYYPDRDPGTSMEYKIYVLSRAQHAKILIQKFEEIQDEIEEMTRDEEAQKNSNMEIASRNKSEMMSSQTTQDIDKQKSAEQSNQRRMERTAAKGNELMKEALRNKDISEKTLQKWANLMNDMQQLANSEMQQASQQLSQAAQSSSQQQREQNMEETIKTQEEIIKKMREMQEQSEESIQQTLAESFVNRLKRAASEEDGIRETLLKILEEMPGKDPEDMTPEEYGRVDTNATRQEEVRKEAGYIQDDLAGFFNRTSVPIYDELYKEMNDTRMREELRSLTTMIAKNKSFASIEQTVRWQKQFKDWAARLEEAAQEGQSGESGEQEQAEVDMEVLIGLLRARQEEERIRKQTRLQDEKKLTDFNYSRSVRRLAKDQLNLAADVRELESRILDPRALRFVEKIDGEMMNAGVRLRTPDTGKNTIAIQTEIIELLSQSIQQTASSGSAAQQQMMQQLIAMMSGQSGNSPGPQGNPAPFGGDDPNSDEGGTSDANNQERGGGSGSRKHERRDSSGIPGCSRRLFQSHRRGTSTMKILSSICLTVLLLIPMAGRLQAQELFIFSEDSIPPGVEEAYTKGIRYLLLSQHAGRQLVFSAASRRNGPRAVGTHRTRGRSSIRALCGSNPERYGSPDQHGQRIQRIHRHQYV